MIIYQFEFALPGYTFDLPKFTTVRSGWAGVHYDADPVVRPAPNVRLFPINDCPAIAGLVLLRLCALHQTFDSSLLTIVLLSQDWFCSGCAPCTKRSTLPY